MQVQRLRNTLVVSLAAGAAIAGTTLHGRTGPGAAALLTIGGYALVASNAYDAALDDETYTATITNTGGPTGRQDAVNVTATFYSVSPQVTIVDRALMF